MRIIPAIDLMQGCCVRLTKGDFSSIREYSRNPEEIAEEFVTAGLPRIHIVDLEGARAGRIVQWGTLEAMLAVPGLQAQVGGGVRNDESIERLLKLGAKQVIVGSVAMRSPETVGLWAEKFGADRIVVAADLNSGSLASAGWTQKENTTLDVMLAKLQSSGISNYICTDIARDGTLAGPNFELYSGLVRSYPSLKWIASGGISSLGDLQALQKVGVSAAIVGKALYEGKIQLQDLVSWKS